jgi:hypothetical protein
MSDQSWPHAEGQGWVACGSLSIAELEHRPADEEPDQQSRHIESTGPESRWQRSRSVAALLKRGRCASCSGAVVNRQDREQEDPGRCQSESSRTRR